MDNDTLYKWYKAKKELAKLKKKVEKYKVQVMRKMNQQGTDKLTEGNYTVTRGRVTRQTVSKDSLPRSIWEEYSTRCSYDAYYLLRK